MISNNVDNPFSLYDSILSNIICCDKEGEVIYINPEASKTLHFEQPPENIKQLIPPERRGKHFLHMQGVNAQLEEPGPHYVMNCRVPLLDGKNREILAKMQVVWNHCFGCYVCTVNDITPECTLRTKINHIKAILQNPEFSKKLGYVLFYHPDEETAIIKDISPAYASFLGYRQEELIGKNSYEVLVPLHYREKGQMLQKEVTDNMTTHDVLFPWKAKDGLMHPMRFWSTPLPNKKTFCLISSMNSKAEKAIHLQAIISTMSDLLHDLKNNFTEIYYTHGIVKRDLQELRNSIGELDTSVQEKARLFSGIERVQKSIEVTEIQTHHADFITGQFTSAIDITEGKDKLISSNVDFLKWLKDQRALFTSYCSVREITLVWEQGRVDKSIYVSCDVAKLSRVFSNLILNAIKFIEDPRKIEVSHVLVDDPALTGRLRLDVTIRDTGPGIPAGMEEKIFQKGKTLEHTNSNTGLGLAIVERFIHLMNGNIKVENNVDAKGCSFVFNVSLDKGIPPLYSSAAEKVSDLTPDKRAYRILYAEDSNFIRKGTLRKLLNIFPKATVDDVCDGNKAYKRLVRAFQGNDPYHLAIFDMKMNITPRFQDDTVENNSLPIQKDGDEATKRWRVFEKTQQVRSPLIIIGLTAGDEEDKKLCLEAGMNHILSKGTDKLPELFKIMKRELAKLPGELFGEIPTLPYNEAGIFSVREIPSLISAEDSDEIPLFLSEEERKGKITIDPNKRIRATSQLNLFGESDSLPKSRSDNILRNLPSSSL